MKIKGTSILNTMSFVKNNFPERYEEWLNSLPDETIAIFKDIVLSTHWYDFDTVYLVPLEKIGELFYENDLVITAHEIGKASALKALKGVYKIFVRIASVDFVVKRSTTIFSTYYEKPAKIEVVESTKERIKVEVHGFKTHQSLVFDAIVGWLDGLFSIILKNGYILSFDVEKLGEEDVVAKILVKFSK
jgi:hypothetical protein